MPVVSQDDQKPRVHIARQAILDARGHVVGYELLYRGSVRDTACTVEGDLAGASVLTGAVLDLRLEALTDGRTAFINITRSMLLNGVATLLRPALALFELREDVTIDHEVIEACRALSESGYRLALDDFVPGSPAEVLLPFVSHVKVDTLTMPRDTVAALVRRVSPGGVTVVAEKVETREVFEWARDAGCGLFQGYYFRRPEMRSGGTMPAGHAAHLRLMAALNQPSLTTDRLEQLIKQDATLSLRVLQCINSAAFPLRREVRSIGEALVLLGVAPIRKWASVWCMTKLNAGATSELTTMALLRARACELLADEVNDVDPGELFLVGLCSMLDAILGRPMAEALAELPLSDAARDALLGRQNALRSVLETVIAYEDGGWEEAISGAEVIGAREAHLQQAYTGALSWAHELTSVGFAA
jgi:EAL and modified HD-GYP domain-containing signal transduction protein